MNAAKKKVAKKAAAPKAPAAPAACEVEGCKAVAAIKLGRKPLCEPCMREALKYVDNVRLNAIPGSEDSQRIIGEFLGLMG